MEQLKEKLRLIYGPYLLVTIGFITVYTLLHWAIFIKADLFHLKEDVTKFWLPLSLPWIPILIWLRPRINLLHFKKEEGGFAHQMLIWLATAAPAIVAQEYMTTATGKLTALETITQFDHGAPTKYYTLKRCYVDKTNAGVVKTASVSGRRNKDLKLLIYIALPVLNVVSDTANVECSYFIGKKYSKTVRKNLSEEEEEAVFESFEAQSQLDFDTSNFQQFVYLEKMAYSDDLEKFDQALRKSKYVRYKDPIVFTARQEPFENRNGKSLGWMFLSFGIGALLYLVILFFSKFDETKLAAFKRGIKVQDSDFQDIMELLTPKDGFFITPIILNLNLLLYVAMVVAGLGFIEFSGGDLLDWGANYRPYTTNGAWWRLLTSVFLHGDIIHLMANLIGFIFVGELLEPLLGRWKFTLVYLGTGILASCASIWWHPATVSIGASGAIFGLYGVLLALLLRRVFSAEFSKIFLWITLAFVGINLFMGLTGGIDNAAHIGGLVSGFVIGIMLAPSSKWEAPEEEF